MRDQRVNRGKNEPILGHNRPFLARDSKITECLVVTTQFNTLHLRTRFTRVYNLPKPPNPVRSDRAAATHQPGALPKPRSARLASLGAAMPAVVVVPFLA